MYSPLERYDGRCAIAARRRRTGCSLSLRSERKAIRPQNLRSPPVTGFYEQPCREHPSRRSHRAFSLAAGMCQYARLCGLPHAPAPQRLCRFFSILGSKGTLCFMVGHAERSAPNHFGVPRTAPTGALLSRPQRRQLLL